MNLPVYDAMLKDEQSGIFAVSFVDFPATEQNFVALKKPQPVKLLLNSQKQILTGVVLMPNQLIYRNDDYLGEYYMKFSAAELEKIALKMMKEGVALKNTTHQHEKPLKGNYLTELWLVKDSKCDKSVALGLGELPVGTIVASYKIEDAKYWRDEVITGKVKGFSIEGLFNFNTVKMKKKDKKTKEAKSKKVPEFFRSIATFLEGETEADTEDLVDEAAKDQTDSGEPYLIFELSDGGEIYVDSEGFCTRDGEQMPAGEHALADGNFIVIDDNGNMVITEPEPDGLDPAEAVVDMAKKRAKLLLKKMNPHAARIAVLEKEIQKLKKQPSAPPAKPKIEGVTGNIKSFDQMTPSQRAAVVLRQQRERKEKK